MLIIEQITDIFSFLFSNAEKIIRVSKSYFLKGELGGYFFIITVSTNSVILSLDSKLKIKLPHIAHVEMGMSD